MEEYKGIYYGDEVEQQYYEGGAHFKYSKLYKILEKISKDRYKKEKAIQKEKEKALSHANKNNKLIKSSKKMKKTRNIHNYLDMIKISYNTFGNNRSINIKNNKFKKDIFLSLNKGNNNKEDNKNNYSISRYKKETDSRNKDSINVYRGRPNTIFKDRFQKRILFLKKKKLISTSMEHKDENKNRYPIDLKKSLPLELNSNNIRQLNNYNTHKKKLTISDLGLNYIKNTNNKSKDDKNNNIKNISINDARQNQNISLFNNNNNNKIYLKTEKEEQLDTEYNHKKIIENYTEYKEENKNIQNMYINSGQISEKTHDIINKKTSLNKNPQIDMKTKTLISSDILNKSKKDKDNIKMHINRANEKKSNKKDINNHNNTYMEKTNFKNNKKYSKLKDSNNKNLEKINKKYNKNYYKIDYNLLFFNNKLIKKSRNQKGNNIYIRDKNNSNVNNQSKIYYNNNEKYNNYFKSVINMNKTYNDKIKPKTHLNKSNYKNHSKLYNTYNKYKYNYKSNKQKSVNNENSISNNLNESSKTRGIINQFKHIKVNNQIKSKINKNGNSKINKRRNNPDNIVYTNISLI